MTRSKTKTGLKLNNNNNIVEAFKTLDLIAANELLLNGAMPM